MLLKKILPFAFFPLALVAVDSGSLEDDGDSNSVDTKATMATDATQETQKNTAATATPNTKASGTPETAETAETDATEATKATDATSQATKTAVTEATTATTANTNTYGTDSNGNTIWWTPTQTVWWTPSASSSWTPSSSAQVTTITSGSQTMVSTLSANEESGSTEKSTEKSVVISLSTYTSGSKVGTITTSYTTENVHTVLKKPSNSSNAAVQLVAERDYTKVVYPIVACAGALLLI